MHILLTSQFKYILKMRELEWFGAKSTKRQLKAWKKKVIKLNFKGIDKNPKIA